MNLCREKSPTAKARAAAEEKKGKRKKREEKKKGRKKREEEKRKGKKGKEKKGKRKKSHSKGPCGSGNSINSLRNLEEKIKNKKTLQSSELSTQPIKALEPKRVQGGQ